MTSRATNANATAVSTIWEPGSSKVVPKSCSGSTLTDPDSKRFTSNRPKTESRGKVKTQRSRVTANAAVPSAR